MKTISKPEIDRSILYYTEWLNSMLRTKNGFANLMQPRSYFFVKPTESKEGYYVVLFERMLRSFMAEPSHKIDGKKLLRDNRFEIFIVPNVPHDHYSLVTYSAHHPYCDFSFLLKNERTDESVNYAELNPARLVNSCYFLTLGAGNYAMQNIYNGTFKIVDSMEKINGAELPEVPVLRLYYALGKENLNDILCGRVTLTDSEAKNFTWIINRCCGPTYLNPFNKIEDKDG